MRILAIELSSSTGGVALSIGGHVVREEINSHPRSHSELISPFIENCLAAGSIQIHDLNAVAIGRGPGSFTGLRVAASVGKSLSYALKIPLVAVDSLQILASQILFKENFPEYKQVLCMVNAHKNLLYAALYEKRGAQLVCSLPPQVQPPQIVEGWIQGQTLVLGDGLETMKYKWNSSFLQRVYQEEEFFNFPPPSTLARLAENEVQSGRVIDWKVYTPLYLRASEAEEKLHGA